MALEYLIVKQTGGETSGFVTVDRPAGISDTEYKIVAHAEAIRLRAELGQEGLSGVVGVCSVDAPTSSEFEQQIRMVDEIEVAGGALPTIHDILGLPQA